jgi:cytochrome c oxidase assembly protein subunit 15
MVVVQGILGGVRVTALSLPLAMVHGIFAQLFFGTLVALGAFTSATWRRGPPATERANAETDRVITWLLVAAIFCQLILGAAQRHFQLMLIVHIMIGVAAVAPLALLVGVRAWGFNREQRLLQRLGLMLIAAISVQLVLGLAAFVVTGAVSGGGLSRGYDLVISTAHQWFGAVLLALAVLLGAWTGRLLAPAAKSADAPSADSGGGEEPGLVG